MTRLLLNIEVDNRITGIVPTRFKEQRSIQHNQVGLSLFLQLFELMPQILADFRMYDRFESPAIRDSLLLCSKHQRGQFGPVDFVFGEDGRTEFLAECLSHVWFSEALVTRGIGVQSRDAQHLTEGIGDRGFA